MIDPSRFNEALSTRLRRGEPFVVVTIVDCHGSAPASVGCKMIVNQAGLDFGTVGGGRIEARAIDEAINLVASAQPSAFVDWSLKADVGMTCGGRVKLYFELVNAAPWSIVIFGAGHVTQALAPILDTISCRVTVVDPREQWIKRLPASITAIVEPEPAAHVASVQEDSFILCMTKGHSADLPVLRKIYELDRTFPFVGVIGSDAKAAVLRKELRSVGIDASRLTFHCPVGLIQDGKPIGNHDPAEIAISIVAQLLSERASWQARGAQRTPLPSRQ